MLLGIMIPFIGTTLGAACVFFMQKAMNITLQKILSGFAAGVMVAASVWSLLIPSMDMAENLGKLAFLPAAAGMMFGIAFLLFLDRLIPHLHADTGCHAPQYSGRNGSRGSFCGNAGRQ